MRLSLIIKCTVSVLLIALLSACNDSYKSSQGSNISGKNTSGSYSYPETLGVNFGHNQASWHVANQASLEGKSLTEVIPAGDDINNWQQLVSITYSSYVVMPQSYSVQHAMAEKLEGIKADCKSHLTTRVLNENANEVTYEIQLKGCGSGMLADQTQVARIIKGRYGFNSVHYAVKAPLINEAKLQEMQAVVSSAQLI